MQFPAVFIQMNQLATNSHSNCMKTLLSPCILRSFVGQTVYHHLLVSFWLWNLTLGGQKAFKFWSKDQHVQRNFILKTYCWFNKIANWYWHSKFSNFQGCSSMSIYKTQKNSLRKLIFGLRSCALTACPLLHGKKKKETETEKHIYYDFRRFT